jgi:hypothetical protein
LKTKYTNPATKIPHFWQLKTSKIVSQVSNLNFAFAFRQIFGSKENFDSHNLGLCPRYNRGEKKFVQVG